VEVAPSAAALRGQLELHRAAYAEQLGALDYAAFQALGRDVQLLLAGTSSHGGRTPAEIGAILGWSDDRLATVRGACRVHILTRATKARDDISRAATAALNALDAPAAAKRGSGR
jgi:hypothetical protein